jgi:diguanylate cyclase (GGDEF)-like protein
MAPLSPSSIVGTLGVAVHFGGAVMLVVLFLLLRRYELRRGYFAAWMVAWMAMASAILWLVVRYNVLPWLLSGSPGEWALESRALYFSYQISKLLAFLLFVVGTRTYVIGARPSTEMRVAGLIAAGYAAISVLVAASLSELVVWQSPVVVLSLGYCAWALLRLPRSRRSLGSVVTGSGFALLATLWLVYGVAFGLATAYGATAPAWAQLVVTINSYLDFLIDMMLGYGMVVLLMEDGKREVSDAQAELRLAHDHLRRTAFFDALTGSHSRRAFDEGVGLELARTTFGTVLLADLDELKLVNDRFGHPAGDRLLQHCGQVLRDGLRPYDKLYRWGGDEFLIILPSAKVGDALGRLEQVLDSAPALELAPGVSLRLRVSVGGAEYTSIEGMPAAIEKADKAMYARKSHRKATPRMVAAIPGAPATPYTR